MKRNPRINHAPEFFKIMAGRRAGKTFKQIGKETGLDSTTVHQTLYDPAAHRQARFSLWMELCKRGK